MVNINSKIVFLFCLFVNNFFLINAQKLFIPINDSEIISIYKTGDKQDDGSYVSKDKSGNIRIQGKFNKLVPVGKWFIFFERDDPKSVSKFAAEFRQILFVFDSEERHEESCGTQRAVVNGRSR